MSGRAAKLARVIPIETPDNSSSDSESEGEEGRDAEIQVRGQTFLCKVIWASMIISQTSSDPCLESKFHHLILSTVIACL